MSDGGVDDRTRTAAILADALPFVRAIQGQRVVVRCGGAALRDPVLRATLARDVSLLGLIGPRVVLVHGAGGGVEDLIDRLCEREHRAAAARPPAETPEDIAELALTEINRSLVAQLNAEGAMAVGVSGRDAAAIGAESIDRRFFDTLLDAGYVPVVMPIAWQSGAPTRLLDPDLLAGRIAVALGARSVVLMADRAGPSDAAGRALTGLAADELDRVPACASAAETRLATTRTALRQGVELVHLIDARVPHSLLLELLTSEGGGTTVWSAREPHFLADTRHYLDARPGPDDLG